jgi:hypothetical protein
MKLATVFLIPVFVGCLGAQTDQTETKATTTTTVNLNGTLVDQGCYTTRSKETTTDQNSTTEVTKVVTECPVTANTNSFALMTPEGKIVRFDDASNTRVVEMLKSNKDWQDQINGHQPVKVRVVAMPNGELMVIKEIK